MSSRAQPPISSTGPRPTAPHLIAAGLAVGLFLAGVAVLSATSTRVVARRNRALAGSRFAQKTYGLVVQREALRHDDLLPLYGSSEVNDARMAPYHARDLFARAPSGFSVLTVGRRGLPLLATMQNLGALGADLRGKKVAISLSPGMFLWGRGHAMQEGYAGNFSALHALTLMSSRDVSPGLKQRIARRLLSYPETLKTNKVLDQTVRCVAAGARSPLCVAFRPLAELERRLLEAQDHVLVLEQLIRTRPKEPGRAPRALDWAALEREATSQFRARATNNAFGFADRFWAKHGTEILARRASSSDRDFLDQLSHSEAWDDLEQLLLILDEQHAQPLLLTMPFHRAFMEYTGVSAAPLGEYLSRLRAVAARHRVSTASFEDHESDREFLYDPTHLSHKGWVYYDRALDAFFHDTVR